MTTPLILAHELDHAANDPPSEWIYSLDQLWARLGQLWSGYPRQQDEIISVALQHPKPSVLRIGFGDGDWVLIYQDSPSDIVIALGDPNAEGRRRIALPEWTSMHRKYVLLEDVAKRAIEHWAETGEKDPRLEWM